MIGRTSPPFHTGEEKRMSEKVTDVKDKIVTHVKDHKWIYIAGAGSFVAGVLVAPKQIVIVDALKGIQWRSPAANTVTAVLARRGHPGYIIQCNETGETFASIARAAEAYGINRPNLTSHLNGRLDQVGGHTFTNLGEAS